MSKDTKIIKNINKIYDNIKKPSYDELADDLRHYKNIYKNLIECVNTNLTNPILGENYYNMGMDVYTCDLFLTQDIAYQYNHYRSSYRIVGCIAIVTSIIRVITSVLLFIR